MIVKTSSKGSGAYDKDQHIQIEHMQDKRTDIKKYSMYNYTHKINKCEFIDR